MSLPSVCVLIPSFARTALLAEAVECVLQLQRRYKGRVYAHICNDCTRQEIKLTATARLLYSTDNGGKSAIDVYDMDTRFHSLADKRHFMLQQASTDYLCFLDDDDLMLPWYLNALAANPTAPVILPQRRFRTDGDLWWDEVTPGGLSMIVERKLALSVGFTSGLNVGEDNAFRNAVIEKVGKHNLALDPTPSYVYRSTIVGGMHISKATDHRGDPDIPMYLKSANQRMDDGREPTGVVEIVPRWREDYAAKARSVMGEQ